MERIRIGIGILALLLAAGCEDIKGLLLLTVVALLMLLPEILEDLK